VSAAALTQCRAILYTTYDDRGARCWWRSWSRHCATSRKVAVSIPDGVIRWHNPSGRTIVLGSTQLLTEMNTRNFLGGKGCRCVGMTTLQRSCADCLEFLNLLEPYVPVQACNGVALPLWRSWLRHCTTSRKVAVSIPDGVIGIFRWHNPSGRTKALGSTQLLTEMNTRNFEGGKGGLCVGLTTLQFSCADCRDILNLLEPYGPVQACNGVALPSWWEKTTAF
jgi:hypothetical protein